MARRLRRVFGGFADPARRTKWIIVSFTVLILLIAASIPVFAVTTSTGFCENACHKVQDDTITAYQHSVHSKVACVACHLPVGRNPLTFAAHEISSLKEVGEALTNNYSLPLNKNDYVALTMPSVQCTQCHDLSKNSGTTNPRVIVLHQIHTAKGVACTICHNRVGHNEDFALKLTDPSGAKNQKHTDFMTMPACFRCHTQEPVKDAPSGKCTRCHDRGSAHAPTNHQSADFLQSEHGKLASAEESRVPWLNAKEPTSTAQGTARVQANGADSQYSDGEALKKVSQVNTCSTCHAKSFCTDCHGLQMPHPTGFRATHAKSSAASEPVCAKCHGSGANSCSDCHHGTEIGYKIDPSRTWLQQHSDATGLASEADCARPGGCHSSPAYCADCHANHGTMPPGAPPL